MKDLKKLAAERGGFAFHWYSARQDKQMDCQHSCEIPLGTVQGVFARFV